jgi:hypothetical protein
MWLRARDREVPCGAARRGAVLCCAVWCGAVLGVFERGLGAMGGGRVGRGMRGSRR